MDPVPFEPQEEYELHSHLRIPGHVTSLAFGHASHLFAGSGDGSLRVYDLSINKVIKAVQRLGDEISFVICDKRPGSELRDAWVACGRRILKFQMDSPSMIQTAKDALVDIGVDAEDEDDALNEISLNSNKTHIAFCMDSGTVGVVDLATNVVKKMRTKHTSICGNVKFIPDRPREIVSGGYDTGLLHFDFHEGKQLSAWKFSENTPVVGGPVLSPPFIMSMAIHPNGMLAAGAADGRLMIAYGGVKSSSLKGVKKKRKWEGFNGEHVNHSKPAEGPIVAMAFDGTYKLTMSTLLGLLMRYEIFFDEEKGSVTLEKTWQQRTRYVEKVNALAVDEKRVVVGGLTAEGLGVIEIWKKNAND